MIIFVFGSNLAGRHGAGAALEARRHYGAIYGQGEGPMGQSYALPTKNKQLRTLDLKAIQENAETFKAYAHVHKDMLFLVTAVGCGLAGHRHEQIAPMFADSPENCFFDKRWAKWLS